MEIWYEGKVIRGVVCIEFGGMYNFILIVFFFKEYNV